MFLGGQANACTQKDREKVRANYENNTMQYNV